MGSAVSCMRFGALQICDGDLVAITLTRGETVVGIVRIDPSMRHYGFIALVETPQPTIDDCSRTPTTTVSLRRIALLRILARGVCAGEPGA